MRQIPYVLAHDDPAEAPNVREKRNAIRDAFAHAYGGYEKQYEIFN